MTGVLTESVVEQAALAWLQSGGWSFKNGAENAPSKPAAERANGAFRKFARFAGAGAPA